MIRGFKEPELVVEVGMRQPPIVNDVPGYPSADQDSATRKALQDRQKIKFDVVAAWVAESERRTVKVPGPIGEADEAIYVRFSIHEN